MHKWAKIESAFNSIQDQRGAGNGSYVMGYGSLSILSKINSTLSAVLLGMGSVGFQFYPRSTRESDATCKHDDSGLSILSKIN